MCYQNSREERGVHMTEGVKTAVSSLATDLIGQVNDILPIMLPVVAAVIAAGFVIKLVKKFAK